ncbi:MAG TPA: HEAT repeat domain-containing protein [Candidatus Atribacteria bacterium]|nr:HEAT repeat domain-containing protein [Candidatus Atribacteria bacterium]
MTKKGKKPQKEIESKIKKLIKELKKYDGMEYSVEMEEELKEIEDKLVSCGKSAVPQLIEVLNKHTWRSSWHAANALGAIGDKKAIVHLVNTLEEPELGENAKDALKKFGLTCIPSVIKKVEYRIKHPIKDASCSLDIITAPALDTIGEIRCEESAKFLNNMLDDYISEMPDEPFDPAKHDWKYRNVDLFHLIDCMVRQQDKSAIPHIRKARDFFPENYTDYKICQIAIGRIKKGKVEGYLPLEALEIAMPSGAIMDALSGGELGWKDTFDEEYGEYFENDEEDEE